MVNKQMFLAIGEIHVAAVDWDKKRSLCIVASNYIVDVQGQPNSVGFCDLLQIYFQQEFYFFYLQSKTSSKPSPFDFSFTVALINASAANHQTTTLLPPSQSHTSPIPTPDAGNRGLTSPPTDLATFKDELRQELQSETVKPPEIDQLIQQSEALLSAPSANVTMRQTIADFPPEVSDPQIAMKNISEGGSEPLFVPRDNIVTSKGEKSHFLFRFEICGK